MATLTDDIRTSAAQFREFGACERPPRDEDPALIARIRAQVDRWGERLVILAHHYQRKEVVPFGNFIGDSYYLSKMAAQQEKAEHIVFCGVHFMAESARILCRPEQHVYLPNLRAGCPMADMADDVQVDDAWEWLGGFLDTETVIPVSYMNSAANLKAFTGANGGLICTSSNADKAFAWAFERGEKVFFFPDEHLGTNTANKMGIARDRRAIYDPLHAPDDPGPYERAQVILWKGFCHVHTNFTVAHIESARRDYPGIKIVVHPECTEDVVNAADACGSTAFIDKYVKAQPAGSIIAIGTEINLTSRLADEHPDKTIFELSGQNCPLCVNMFRTTLEDLASCLEHLGDRGHDKQIFVRPDVARDAKLALNRMLELK
ncbi:MAG: quinolinate synthase NadA [candidate division Zixibacteria bacterium]|nr:quinolinate synthase NadA [candidate division Zixibacteria bacterium]